MLWCSQSWASVLPCQLHKPCIEIKLLQGSNLASLPRTKESKRSSHNTSFEPSLRTAYLVRGKVSVPAWRYFGAR